MLLNGELRQSYDMRITAGKENTGRNLLGEAKKLKWKWVSIPIASNSIAVYKGFSIIKANIIDSLGYFF